MSPDNDGGTANGTDAKAPGDARFDPDTEGLPGKLLGSVCMALLFGLAGVTVLDVVGRYWFDAPISGAFELTQLMLAALIFAALPLTTAARGHVEVDLIAGALPQLLRPAIAWLGAIVSAAALAVFSWRLAVHAVRLAADGSVTNALDVPLAPLAWLGAISCGASAVIALMLAWRGERV